MIVTCPAANPATAPFVDFIDDYFVECDEHLTVVRTSLLALEASVNKTQVDRSSLDELFRSFHSIKGLSAMVGVRDAELLAHQMESYLSSLHTNKFASPPPAWIRSYSESTRWSR